MNQQTSRANSIEAARVVIYETFQIHCSRGFSSDEEAEGFTQTKKLLLMK